MSEVLEKGGVLVHCPGDVFVRLARAGGANTEFFDAFGIELRPYRLAIAAEQLSEATARRVLARAYARAAIRDLWGPGTPVEQTIATVAEWLLSDEARFNDLIAVAEDEKNYTGEGVRVYG